MNNSKAVPVFPLSIFILPGGISRIRVFEAKYLRLVTIAMKQRGFIIVDNTVDINHKEQWASWVEVINFDQGPEGILEVDVKCKSLVNLTSFYQESDGLSFATIEPTANWSQLSPSAGVINASSLKMLSQSLWNVFKSNSLLNELYIDKQLDNACWVVARWLELLPIANETKKIFVCDDSFEVAKDFVQSIIHQEKIILK